MIAQFVEHHAVLDLRRRHLDERMRVLLARLVGAGGVQQSDKIAERIDDRRRHAAQGAVAGEEMLAAVDRRRPRRLKRQPQRVAATLALAPDAAGNDVAPGLAVGEHAVAQRIEHDAFRVGESDHEIRTGDLRVQCLHFGERERAQHPRLLATANDVREGLDDIARRAGWIEAIGDRPPPAFGDGRGQGAFGKPLAIFQRGSGAIHRRQQRHGSSFFASRPKRRAVHLVNTVRGRPFSSSTVALAQPADLFGAPLRRRPCAAMRGAGAATRRPRESCK